MFPSKIKNSTWYTSILGVPVRRLQKQLPNNTKIESKDKDKTSKLRDEGNKTRLRKKQTACNTQAGSSEKKKRKKKCPRWTQNYGCLNQQIKVYTTNHSRSIRSSSQLTVILSAEKHSSLVLRHCPVPENMESSLFQSRISTVFQITAQC